MSDDDDDDYPSNVLNWRDRDTTADDLYIAKEHGERGRPRKCQRWTMRRRITVGILLLALLVLLTPEFFTWSHYHYSAWRIIYSSTFNALIRAGNWFPYYPPAQNITGLPNNIIFVKPAKVGGTTMREILRNVSVTHGMEMYDSYDSGGLPNYINPYRISYVELSEFRAKPSTMEYITLGDHGSYNTFYDYFAPNAFRLTLLRHPVKRAVSKYLYHNHLQYGDDEASFDTSYRTATGEMYKCTRGPFDTVEEALDNYHLVAILERFDESLVLLTMMLSDSLSVEDVVYFIQNVESKKISFPEEMRPEFEQIYGDDDIDMALYNAAYERLEHEIAIRQPEFDKQYARFQFLMGQKGH